MNLAERDQEVIWHPLTQHFTAKLPISIDYAEGAYLIDVDGKRYLDLISSWWVNIHGHACPEISNAIYAQAQRLEQVIFSGFTHQPAVELAEKLLALLPSQFSKVFYSDNGSTAVEVALKMAYQYWQNKGEVQRTRFIAFDGGYHGDTFGAMSVGKSSGFFKQFTACLFKVDIAPYPATWLDDENIIEKENNALAWLEEHLSYFSHETAAIIIEPLIQGSIGMHMCSSNFLLRLEVLARSHDVLIIYDEVMTGFGRTGELFACLKAKTTPDIICLAKGLTGGFLPLAVTACQEKIYHAFLGEDFNLTFAHSHSFTANPLGCAAALASLTLLQNEATQTQIKRIETTHQQMLTEISSNPYIEKFRYCGTIAAFDLVAHSEYGSKASQDWRNHFLNQGLLVRPLGNVIYLMPPYCLDVEALKKAYVLIENIISSNPVSMEKVLIV